MLHRLFDELCADYLSHNRGSMPSTTTMNELMNWSARQTESAYEPNNGVVHPKYICAHCGEPMDFPDSHVCPEECGLLY